MVPNCWCAGLVIAVNAVARRKELALDFGGDVVVDFTEKDSVQAILDLTEGQGVDAAIEAISTESTFEACIKAMRPGGVISNIGYHGRGDFLRLPRLAWDVGMSDKTIRTGLCPGGAERMKRLLRLLVAGRVDPTPLTTHRFSFDQIEKAFRMMETKEDGIIKPLITFT